MYLKAYSAMIHPILHVKRWPPMLEVLPKTVLSPPLRRAPGRPRVNRRREANEGASSSQPKRSSTLKCGNCGAFGHNKRTCKGQPVHRTTANKTTAELVVSHFITELHHLTLIFVMCYSFEVVITDDK